MKPQKTLYLHWGDRAIAITPVQVVFLSVYLVNRLNGNTYP
jgi:hypothetical protein